MALYILLGASLPLHLCAACLFVPLIYFRMVSVSLRLSGTNKGINLYHSVGVSLVDTKSLRL